MVDDVNDGNDLDEAAPVVDHHQLDDDDEGFFLDKAALGVDHHRLKDWLLSWKRGSHLTTSPFLQNKDLDFQPRNLTMLDKKIHPPPLCPTPGESCRWLEGPRLAQGRCLLEGGVDLWQGRNKRKDIRGCFGSNKPIDPERDGDAPSLTPSLKKGKVNFMTMLKRT